MLIGRNEVLASIGRRLIGSRGLVLLGEVLSLELGDGGPAILA